MVCWLRRLRSLYTDTAVLSVLGGSMVKAGEKLVH